MEVWATTFCPGARVKIYSDPELSCKAETHWIRGVCSIHIRASLLGRNPRTLFALLVHEFTHVVEYLNDPIYLSPVLEDECTALAQTMEAQLTPLILNLKMKKGAHNPLKSLI